MLFIIVMMLTVFMAIEKIVDASHENRIINPILGVVITLLVSAFFCPPAWGRHTSVTYTTHISVCCVHTLRQGNAGLRICFFFALGPRRRGFRET